jgi:anti-sigma B factor antagonist
MLTTRNESTSPKDLVVRSAYLADFSVLGLVGELDSSNVCGLRQALAELPTSKRVILDLSELSFVDSIGLGAIIGCAKKLRQVGGEMTLAGASPPIRKVLNMTGIDRISQVHTNIEDAIGALVSSDHRRAPA